MAIVKRKSRFRGVASFLGALSAFIATPSLSLITTDFASPPYTDPEKWHPTVVEAINATAPYGYHFLILAGLFWGSAYLLPFFLKDPQESWEWARFFVQRARDKAYETLDSEVRHHHRVTLFKYVERLPRESRHWSAPAPVDLPLLNLLGLGTLRNYWTRGGKHSGDKGWLVPVIRSDMVDCDCLRSSVYAVPSDNLDKHEGVVGYVFRAQYTRVVINAPNVSSSNPAFRAQYATNTNCTREMIDTVLEQVPSGQVKTLPRTIGAAPVVLDNGDKWGVLVFDSKSPDVLPDADELNNMFSTTIKGLEKALGGKA